jgi:CYTH domain-containing protein
MPVSRRFCLAPAFARLIKRERVAVPIIEGHFPDQSERRSYVRMEGDHCILVLENRDANGAVEEERSEVSRAQGEVLLDVCAGKTTLERINLDAANGALINVERFTAPVAASFVEVTLPDEASAKAFRPPIWMGAELGPDDVGDARRIALGGKPKLFDGPIHNAALESLLDLLDHRAPRYGTYRGGDDPMMSALRRLVKQPGDQGEGERSSASQKAPEQGFTVVGDDDAAFDVEAPANGAGNAVQQPLPRLPVGQSAKPRA